VNQVIEDDDLVGTLMRTAGRRAVPSDSMREAAFNAASRSLERKLRARRQRRWLIRIAATALVMVGVAILLDSFRVGPRPGEPRARVDRLIGTVESRPSATAPRAPLEQGAELAPGTWLTTRAGSRAGLLLGDRLSLRLAANTEIELVSATEIQLTTGKIYVDTGTQADGGPSLRVRTGSGITRDVGTRFEVAFRDGRYRLRVRQGVVILDRDDREWRTSAGEEMTVDPHGSVTRATIAPDSPHWQWAADVAPRPDRDGAPLSEFLAWVARETGRDVRYAPPELADRAKITMLHGHVEGLRPLDALAVMLATTDFEHSLDDDGTILIKPRETDPRRP
jgi:ferric-dicitrate binding protein FerR (iron transport regulator)